MTMPEFTIGDLVHDRDDDAEPNEAVVINTPPVVAAEWDAYEKWDGNLVTVAEDNPDYPADADVIVVAFRDELADAFPDWPEREEAYPLSELSVAGVAHYAFPAPRLTPAKQSYEEASLEEAGDDPLGEAPAEAADEEPAVPEALAALETRLADANWKIEVTDNGLTVEKLGEQYTILPDGTVEGEGNIREPLEHTIAKHVDVE